MPAQGANASERDGEDMRLKKGVAGEKTLHEIMSQPKIWRELLESLSEEGGCAGEVLRNHAREAPMLFTGCGSSYYVALSAASVVQSLTGWSTKAVPASELLLTKSNAMTSGGKQLIVSISRSGESTETVRTMSIGDNDDILTLGVTCDRGSTLAARAQHSLIASGAVEESVVMTRSFTTQLLALLYSAAVAKDRANFLAELSRLPELVESLLAVYPPALSSLAQDLGVRKFVFLGTGPYFGVACEAALKMREMALECCCEYYQTLEYRHGPISTLDESTLIVLCALDDDKNLEMSFMRDVRARGARTMVICDRLSGGWRDATDHQFELSSGLSNDSRILLYLPLLQLFAFYRAIKNGQNPDSPRHLSQVVTLSE